MKIVVWLFVLVLFPVTVFAGEVLYEGQTITFNDKYSGKGYPYHGLSFKDATDLKPGTIIYASVFYQEWAKGDVKVEKHIFPDTMKGVTFYNCNLDNVYVDETKNTIIGGTHLAIQVQNDWDDWVLDNNLKPIEPMNKERRMEAGISINPKDISSVKFTKKEREQYEKTLNNISN